LKRILPLVLFGLALALFACKRQDAVTQAECGALVQKYFDMKTQEDPRLAAAAPDKRDEMIRQMKAELMATDSDMRQVSACTNELTRGEYECAIKATTTKQWNDCIE
jgi:hypothetical protein